jgi:integrase
MERQQRLVACLLYGAGLRLVEALGLRLRDMQLDRHEIVVRGGEGGSDRVAVLPAALRGRFGVRSNAFVRDMPVTWLAAPRGSRCRPA